jgi:hypothetical protein
MFWVSVDGCMTNSLIKMENKEPMLDKKELSEDLKITKL